MKYLERIAWLYYEFGLNNPFDINQAISCMINNNDTKNKSTLRSSIDIAWRDNLISIDFSDNFSSNSFIDRDQLRWHSKLKTFYVFNQDNLINIVKKARISPLEGDINPEIVKLFLER